MLIWNPRNWWEITSIKQKNLGNKTRWKDKSLFGCQMSYVSNYKGLRMIQERSRINSDSMKKSIYQHMLILIKKIRDSFYWRFIFISGSTRVKAIIKLLLKRMINGSNSMMKSWKKLILIISKQTHSGAIEMFMCLIKSDSD